CRAGATHVSKTTCNQDALQVFVLKPPTRGIIRKSRCYTSTGAAKYWPIELDRLGWCGWQSYIKWSVSRSKSSFTSTSPPGPSQRRCHDGGCQRLILVVYCHRGTIVRETTNQICGAIQWVNRPAVPGGVFYLGCAILLAVDFVVRPVGVQHEPNGFFGPAVKVGNPVRSRGFCLCTQFF